MMGVMGRCFYDNYLELLSKILQCSANYTLLSLTCLSSFFSQYTSECLERKVFLSCVSEWVLSGAPSRHSNVENLYALAEIPMVYHFYG